MPSNQTAIRGATATSPLNRLLLRSRFDLPSRSWSLPSFENARDAAVTLAFFSRQLAAGPELFFQPPLSASALTRDGLFQPKESGRGR
jgi:hypothetical protein